MSLPNEERKYQREMEELMTDTKTAPSDEKVSLIYTKKKIIQTWTLYYGFICLGMITSIVGPTLLDLQLQIQSDTSTMFYIFTGRSLGGLVGTSTAGALVERYNNWVLISATALILSGLVILIPFMTNIISLAIVMVAGGAAIGFFGAANNALLLTIWGPHNGPWMQALHFMFAMGCLVGPLLAEPFLAPTQPHLISPNTTNSHPFTVSPDIANSTEIYHGPANKSRIWIAYVTLGGLFVISSLGYTIMYLTGNHTWRLEKNSQQKHKLQEQNQGEPQRFRFQLVSLLFIFSISYVFVENGFMNFVMTYSVKYLNWSKSMGAQVTAAYLGSFMVGRGMGIPLVHYMKPQTLLALDCFMAASSLIPIVFAAHLHTSVLWVSSIALGFSVATVFATLITWTERYIRVTGPIVAMFLIATATGDLVAPVIFAALFNPLGPGSFAYIIFAASLCVLGIYVVMQIIASRQGERYIYDNSGDHNFE